MKLLIIPLIIVMNCTLCLGEAPNKLRIGVIQSLTGIAAEDGKTVVQSLKLAASDIKNSTGTEIELIIEDDQTSSKNAVSAFQKLSSSNLDAIIAATWDFTTNPLLPLAAQRKIPLFNTSSLPESLNIKEANGFAFINSISTSSEAAPFMEFLKRSKAKTLSIVYANNSWGETQLKSYRELAKEAGLLIIDEIKPASYDENEWRSIVPKVKSKSPEMVLLLLNKNDLSLFLRRSLEISFRPTFFASKNAYDAFNMETSKALFEGLCFTYPLHRSETQNEFVSKYFSAFGEKPRIYADNTYDSLFIIEKAWKAVQTNGLPIVDSLKQVTHQGLVGSYKFNPSNSFSLGESSLVCVDNGTVNVIMPQ